MISILLPTFNGEKYISEQIDSILAQSNKNFKLYILDDLSTDNTFSIIKDYRKRYPDIISVEQNTQNSGGANFNFMKLITQIKDDYIMLCDQDDVWLDDKIELTLEKMTEMENEFGSSTPLLVHTDLTVTDENLKIIAQSYKRMANIDYNFNRLNNLISMNVPTGCTMMYNRALSELLTNEPDYIVMHDWWVSLVASAFGEIGGVNVQTLLYRQHSGNSIGAKKVLSLQYIHFVLSHIGIMANKLNNSYRQARSFLNIYRQELNGVQLELVTAYATMSRKSKLGKLNTIIRYNTFLCGLPRKIAQMLVILFG